MRGKGNITILVEGRPVEEYLQQQNKEEIEKEAQGIFSEIERDIRKSLPKYIPERYQPKERNSRTKFLSEDQIRKEKGVMAKPLKTMKENILWLLANNNSIKFSLKQISAGISAQTASVQTAIRTLQKTIPDILVRERASRDREKGKPGEISEFFYSYQSNLPPEAAYEEYKRRIVEGRKGEQSPLPKKEKTEPISFPDNITVNVIVSGSIKVVLEIAK